MVVALLASSALIASACTRSDGEVEAGSSESTTTTESGSGSTGGAGEGDFGDLSEVCGPGDASGATAQGVTDDSIQVGTISDAGFSGRPGLNQELWDAAEVFVAWCNDAGGINGRKLEVVERDAKLSEYKQRITEACAEDFMLVGGGGVFDDTGQVERVSCLLPEIPAYQVSPQSRDSDLIVNPLPRGLDSLDIGGLNYLDETFPDSTDSVGFLTGTIPSTVFIDAQLQEGAEALGWEKVYEAQYNPAGESSWTPFAQAIKSAGVRGLVYSGEPENLAALQQALADIDYELDWTLAGNNALDAGFIEIGGDAVSNVFISPNMVPPFMASENPATQQYLDLFEEHLPDGKSEAGLGYNAFSAWLLFATAVKECGSEVTRSCVWDAASSITEWTGGGLHGQTNPGEGIPSTCVIIVEGTPDGFVVPEDFEPNEGLYDCSEDNVIDLEADYGEGVSLESVGKSLDDLQ